MKISIRFSYSENEVSLINKQTLRVTHKDNNLLQMRSRGNASIATSTIIIDQMNLVGIAISEIEKLKKTNGNA